MSNNVLPDPVNTNPNVDKGAFGEVSTSEDVSVIQISANYGLLEGVVSFLDTGGSGSTTAENSLFKANTGTDADGFASILSLDQLTTQAGQGALTRFSAIFDTPVADNQQVAGLITSENTLAFGYVGTSFGIITALNGENENQELTYTTPAAGAEVATVTINGVGYPVNLSGAGTVQDDAYETATQLNGTVPNYTITSNNDQVVATATVPAPQGAFAFTSATAVAAWSQINAGVDPTITLIPQASFNVDTVDFLDPQLGNEYQIRYQADFGATEFWVQDPAEKDYILAHVINNANVSTLPIVNNPVFRVGWLVRNVGNTTDVQIQGARASGLIEGPLRNPLNSANLNADVVGIGTTETTVIIIRNRSFFNQKLNRATLQPLLLALATQTTKTCFFSLVLNPVFAANVTFEYFDKATSPLEFSLDNVGITSFEKRLTTLTVVSNQSQILTFSEDDRTEINILPNFTIAITARMSAAPAADVQVSSTVNQVF